MEKKRYEIPTNKQKLSGAPIVYTEQNSQWYLTINAGIGMKNAIRNLANFMLGFGKNGIIGCLRIGKVKI